MKICGIDLSSNTAALVVLEIEDNEFEVVKTELPKIELKDPYNPDHVKSFKQVFDTFIRDHNIDVIAIKKRQDRGKFASSGTSFKIEGLIELTNQSEVDFITHQLITSTLIDNEPDIPDTLFKYQSDAFKTAYTYWLNL